MEHCRCQKAYTPNTRAERISDIVESPPQKNQYSTDVFHRWNLSWRTGFNICTKESSIINPSRKIWKCTKGIIEDPSRNIKKSKPPSSNFEGASQGGRPKENPRSEQGRNPDKKCTAIKAINQLRNSEGTYCRCTPRWTRTSEPIKNPEFSVNQKTRFNSYTKNWKKSKNEIWENKSG